MKIAFIYPGITQGGFGNLKGNEGSWINHGLCSLSAVMKKNGHEVSLIDLRTLSSWDDFSIMIRHSDAQVFAITVMSVDFNIANQCADIIKKVQPKKVVVFGGAHPSISPEETLKNENVDYVVCGEGEVSFLYLVNELAAGKKVERLINGQRPNLDKLPFVDREIFSMREEPFVDFLKPPFVTLIAGRGCTYNCNYCQPAEKKIFGHKVRRRSVANVVAELKELDEKFGFNSFMFHDDCLTEDKQWINDFCVAYQKIGFKKQFVCQSRADLVCKNKDLIKMFKDIGLELMIIGFESGSQRVLNFIGKGTKIEQNFEAAEICHKLGIKIWANYMLGLPGETKEEQMMTLEMIKKIRPYHCSPAYYTPHPGSRLFDYCLENDLSLIKKPEDYRRNTYEPKIKGIDYEYLKNILYESVSYGEDSNVKYVGKEVKPILQKKRVSLKLFKILYLNKLRDKVSLAAEIIKAKFMNLAGSGSFKKIVLLSKKDIYDTSIVFVNMGKVRNILDTWCAESMTNDAQIYLYNDLTKPFNAREYHYVQFYLYSDSPGQGHFTWWLTDGRWQSGKHFLIKKGWKRYCFDLEKMSTYGTCYGSDIRWEGLVYRFRLDPSEEEGTLTKIKKVTLSNLALGKLTVIS